MTVAYRTMLAPWMGGASKGPVAAVNIGMRGMLAFWMGGGSQGSVIPPTPGTSEYLTRARRRGRR